MTTNFTEDQVKALLGMKVNPHGAGGLFSGGPVPDMPVAIPRPSNLAGLLPIMPANTENYVYEILTAASAPTGDTPDSNCGTPQVAGDLAVCRQTLPFGEFYMATEEFNISDGNLRRDITDINRRLMNNPIAPVENPFVPVPAGLGGLDINSILGKFYLTFGQNAANAFSYVHSQGNPSAVTPRRGFITEYNGLDLQIITGTVDSVSSTACTAADSIVTASSGTLDADVVGEIIDTYRGLQMRAMQAGMENTNWVIVAHPTIKHQLFDVWACNYSTVKCTNQSGEFDLTMTAQRRDEMMRGSYLMIDGMNVPVVFDWGMALDVNASTSLHTSDIFIVPMTWGNTPLTWFEYQPMDTGEIPQMWATVGDEVRSMNNGFYLMGHVKNGPYCFSHTFTGKYRLILKYRFLAGRVDDITYTPTVTYRNPDPTGAGYVGGGVTTRT